MIEINAAWYLKTSPSHIVAEAPDGRYFFFRTVPFRELTPDECETYHGHAPDVAGDPIPTIFWQYYGLKLPTEV